GQNLQRLRDILTEVDNQLRGVRLQAAKAQRYQEYTARLRELRLALGLREYRDLSGQLDAAEGELGRLRGELADAAARSSAWAGDVRRLEAESAGLEAAVRDQEAAVAQARVEI